MLLIGPGRWPSAPGTKQILMTNAPFDEHEDLEVVLPLAHPYEQGGSLTNLEGRVQRLEAAGFASPTALPDYVALSRLANTLGVQAPTDLHGIRAALGAEHPGYAKALGSGLPAKGRLLDVAGVAC